MQLLVYFVPFFISIICSEFWYYFIGPRAGDLTRFPYILHSNRIHIFHALFGTSHSFWKRFYWFEIYRLIYVRILESFRVFSKIWCFYVSIIWNRKLLIVNWILLFFYLKTIIVCSRARVKVFDIHKCFSFSFTKILSFWVFMLSIKISSYFIYSLNFIIFILTRSNLIVFRWTNWKLLPYYNFSFAFLI